MRSKERSLVHNIKMQDDAASTDVKAIQIAACWLIPFSQTQKLSDYGTG